MNDNKISCMYVRCKYNVLLLEMYSIKFVSIFSCETHLSFQNPGKTMVWSGKVLPSPVRKDTCTFELWYKSN